MRCNSTHLCTSYYKMYGVTNYYVFTDGACRRNGTPKATASYAYIIYKDDSCDPIHYHASLLDGKKTNNRAELTALIEALRFLVYNHGNVTVYTDSMYVLNIVTNKSRSKANGDLIHTLKYLLSIKRINIIHVNSHTSSNSPEHVGNRYVDDLCNMVLDGTFR